MIAMLLILFINGITLCTVFNGIELHCMSKKVKNLENEVYELSTELSISLEEK